jgi:alkylation response protein AidB-like acyl-CoA dehydrogenase
MGFSMIGPTLLDYGTEDQKLEHLPKIISGEIRWCQGYSEPGAGSDLASLQTRCDDQGDHFEVSGQKIWTSGAQFADWIFTLVRTDFTASKHDGISFVLIDMDQPGVSVRPIQLISGNSPFCETFFDQARCEKKNLVGQLNRGWTVGKRLLQHERSSISGLSGGGRRGRYDHFGTLSSIYQNSIDAVTQDPTGSLRRRILNNEMNHKAFSLTQRRSFEESQSGGTPTFLTSLFKYYGSEQGNDRMELQLEMIGHQGLGWSGDSFDADELATTRTWLRSKASTIAGGSSEVQLNIIAKRVLGLPD